MKIWLMTTNSYSEPEEESREVNEPQAAYGFTAEHLREEMMREALKIEDTSLLQEALEFIRGLAMVQKPPCQYSVEELKEHLWASLDDIKMGRVYTSEELDKEMLSW